LLEYGAVGRLVGPRIGTMATATGDMLEADASLENEPGFLFDGLVLPDGEEAVAALAQDGHTAEFIKDQFRHCKTILAIGASRKLLTQAGLPIAMDKSLAQGGTGLIVVDAGETGSGVEAFLRAQPIFLYPAAWISARTAELDAELPHQLADFPGVATMEKRIAALAAFDATGRLNGLDEKTLVIVADDDILVPYSAGEFLCGQLGCAWLEAIGSGGHACNVTRPARFIKPVLAWLAGRYPEEE